MPSFVLSYKNLNHLIDHNAYGRKAFNYRYCLTGCQRVPAIPPKGRHHERIPQNFLHPSQGPNASFAARSAAFRSFWLIFFLTVNVTSGSGATSLIRFSGSAAGGAGGVIVIDWPQVFLPPRLQWMWWWISNWLFSMWPREHQRQHCYSIRNFSYFRAPLYITIDPLFYFFWLLENMQPLKKSLQASHSLLMLLVDENLRG